MYVKRLAEKVLNWCAHGTCITYPLRKHIKIILKVFGSIMRNYVEMNVNTE